jgi:uncharacterized protein (TIGR03083 family)
VLCEHPLMLTSERCQQSLRESAAAFGQLLEVEELSTPVPSCPGWTMLELAHHVGSVHRWATDCILTSSNAEESNRPTHPRGLVEWYREGAKRLSEVLERRDPREVTWTFGPEPRTVAFWSRRQAHETAMHLWDATNAVGVATEMVTDFAADGVDEVFSVFFPRQVALGRIAPVDRGVLVELTDVPGSPFALAGDGTDPDAPTQAVVRGGAADVLLALWGRAGIERLAVDGDSRMVGEVLASGIVP